MNSWMNVGAVGVVAVGCGLAQAQRVEAVINTAPNSGGSTWGDYEIGTIIDYSIWLRDGDDFGDFYGWALFAGMTHAPGTHLVPDENDPPDQTNGWDVPDYPFTPAPGNTDWNGRRPHAYTTMYEGDGGGFRFNTQQFTPIPNGLEGSNGLPFKGIVNSVPLGGLWQDESPDLEVFRGSFIADTAGIHQLFFELIQASYFLTGSHTTVELHAQNQMTNVPAGYSVTPAPASALILGAGLLATRRRR